MVLLDFHPTQGFMIGAGCVTYSVYLYSAWPIKQETAVVAKIIGNSISNSNTTNGINSNESKNSIDDSSYPLLEKTLPAGKSTSQQQQQLSTHGVPSKTK